MIDEQEAGQASFGYVTDSPREAIERIVRVLPPAVRAADASGYFVTAIDFRNSDTLYRKNPSPTALTIANWRHTAPIPPPR